MARFSYKVKDTGGKTITGSIDAGDTRSVSAILRDQGYFVIDIQTSLPQAILSAIGQRFGRRVGLSEVANFTRQLSVMITSGLTITEGLAILRNQSTNAALEKIISDLIVQVEGGATMAKALRRHSNVFPDIYIEVIRAGETSGLLDKMLTRLADTLEREREFRGKMQGALLYPFIVIIGMGIVMAIMMLFVIPQLSRLYIDLAVELPWPTKIVVAISNFFVSFWYIMVAVLGGGVFAFMSWKKTEVGKYMTDSLILKLPVWGPLQRNINLAEMTRTLSLLTASGTPIIDALQNVGRATRNLLMSEALFRVAKKIEKGLSLGTAFSQETILPPLIAQMARVGEETGKIDEVMGKISVFFEQESERTMQALTTTLQPIILVVLGIGVAFLMISIIFPIYNLLQALPS